MRVDWCVSSWFRIKNTHSLTHVTDYATVSLAEQWCAVSREGCRREGRGYLFPPLLLTCFGINGHDLEWSPSPRQAHDDRPSIPRKEGRRLS